MTRILLLSLLLLVAAMQTKADEVSQEQAQAQASRFFASVGQPSEQAPELVSNVQGFYIFNHPTCNSFVVIAGESRMRTVLAYSLTTKFGRPQSTRDLNGFLLLYAHQYNLLRANPSARVNKLSSPGPARLLRTANWSQSWGFWWNACPMIGDRHAHAGCVPTAMAIMMRYHQWPQHGYGSHSYTSERNGFRLSADFSRRHYNWASLPTGNADDSQWTAESQAAVAQILHDCGIAAGADYGLESTPAATPERWLYYHFGYKLARRIEREQRSDEEWMRLIGNEIANGAPLFYHYDDLGAGHQLICDGYDNNGLLHFNFGWGGKENGFYSIDRVAGDRSATGEEMAIGVRPNRNRDNENLPHIMLVEDDKGYVYSPSIPDRVTRVARFDVALKYMRVMTREPFNGILAAWICDQSGRRKCNIGQKQLNNVVSYCFWQEYKIECHIPANAQVNSGDQIRLFTSTDNGGHWEQVTNLIPDYDHVSLDGHFSGEQRLLLFKTDDPERRAGMEIENGYIYSDRPSYIKIYMVQNASPDHLYGRIALWLCDRNGNGKAMLGYGDCDLQAGYFYTNYSIPVQIPQGVQINSGDAIHLFYQAPNSSSWQQVKYDNGNECYIYF